MDQPQSVDTLVTGSAGKIFIRHFEKFERVAYRKYAKEPWTIGFGNTWYVAGISIVRGDQPYVTKDKEKVRPGDRITQPEADRLFALVLATFEADVRRLIDVPLLQHQFDALVSFAYNAGTSYKRDGKFVLYNLWQSINKGWSALNVAAYLRVTAITSGGIKSNGLIRRRRGEAHLYEFGEVKFFE